MEFGVFYALVDFALEWDWSEPSYWKRAATCVHELHQRFPSANSETFGLTHHHGRNWFGYMAAPDARGLGAALVQGVESGGIPDELGSSSSELVSLIRCLNSASFLCWNLIYPSTRVRTGIDTSPPGHGTVRQDWTIPSVALLVNRSGLYCLLAASSQAGAPGPPAWQRIVDSSVYDTRFGGYDRWWEVAGVFSGAGTEMGLNYEWCARCADALGKSDSQLVDILLDSPGCFGFPKLSTIDPRIALPQLLLFRKVCERGSSERGIRWFGLGDSNCEMPTLLAPAHLANIP